jgi:hypothetical protein
MGRMAMREIREIEIGTKGDRDIRKGRRGDKPRDRGAGKGHGDGGSYE